MAIRQILTVRNEYLKYPFISEIINLWNIFADDSIEENSMGVQLYNASRSIVSLMESGLGKTSTYSYINNPSTILTKKNDKFILCCISGGKDSLAVVLHYLNLGYYVHLYTLKGINRGYPEEYKAAEKVAEKLNLPIYVDEIKVSGKKYFTEHPLKNQVIACTALAYCLENGFAPNLSFGNYRKETDVRSNYGVNWSDNFTLWESFNSFIKQFIPNANVQIPFYEESEALEILNNNSELVPLYQSCLMTVRDRESLRQKNQKKYGVKILPNRCGSCYKCCLEYIYFCDKGKFEYNEGFYKHCLEVLKKKYVDYTGPKEAKVFKNLKEVYQAYFGDSVSRYFNSEIVDNNNSENWLTNISVNIDLSYETKSLW